MAANMGIMTGKFDYAFFVNLECNGKKSVLDWCRTMNLISGEYECPYCNLPMLLKEKQNDIDGYIWVCQQEGEGEHFIERSVRQGSFLQQQSDLSITKILLLTYLWIKKSTREFIEDELDLPLAVVDEWLSFCREICVEICLSKNTTLGGEGILVEIAESRFQKKKFKKDETAEGGWIYVGYEKETDKGFMEIVAKKSVESLINVIHKYILPGTILVSDSWKLYDCLEQEEFIDMRDNQSIKFEDLGVGEFGSSITGLRRSTKRTLNDDPCISYNFDIYLAEYMWRRTKSDNPYELIRSFLEEVVCFFPPEDKD